MTEANQQRRSWLFGIGTLLSIFVMGAGLAPIYFFPGELSSLLQNVGNLGQFIAGVCAPLAFIWVVVAVILQSQELKLQREELALTREEMRTTREVFELQKNEMERAANENREQTRIMTENLRSEAERQIYNEVDIMLYSLAAYIAANWTRSVANGTHIINISALEASLNKDNSDRAYQLVRNSLEHFLANSRGAPIPIDGECGVFLNHCRNQITLLCENDKFIKNRLALVRIESLGLRPILGLLRSIKGA